MTVHEVSALCGVSVRTLHHYDAIGLLPPTAVTPAGYRLYDEAALARLQTILLFRELQFPLKEIREFLDNPAFDEQAVLNEQIHLLELKRAQLDQIIALARNTLQNGGTPMDFSPFDQSKFKEYAQEVKERWGNTDAYRESQKRSAERTDAKEADLAQGMMDIFRRFGALKTQDPGCPAAQALAGELMGYITEHYYPCTPEILAGLGQMYVGDERFRQNIDSAGGQGTARFAADVIERFTK